MYLTCDHCGYEIAFKLAAPPVECPCCGAAVPEEQFREIRESFRRRCREEREERRTVRRRKHMRQIEQLISLWLRFANRLPHILLGTVCASAAAVILMMFLGTVSPTAMPDNLRANFMAGTVLRQTLENTAGVTQAEWVRVTRFFPRFFHNIRFDLLHGWIECGVNWKNEFPRILRRAGARTVMFAQNLSFFWYRTTKTFQSIHAMGQMIDQTMGR